jgi:hypothetical protein
LGKWLQWHLRPYRESRVQQKFAAGRNWRFPMASHAETTFAADIG